MHLYKRLKNVPVFVVLYDVAFSEVFSFPFSFHTVVHFLFHSVVISFFFPIYLAKLIRLEKKLHLYIIFHFCLKQHIVCFHSVSCTCLFYKMQNQKLSFIFKYYKFLSCSVTSKVWNIGIDMWRLSHHIISINTDNNFFFVNFRNKNLKWDTVHLQYY